MLETAPRRWNRVVEGRTPALMQSNQREILGIVFHTLSNWHSGFSGMVVWIAWLVLLGHNPCGQLLRTAQRQGERCCYWLSEEERALLCKCMHFNEHTLSHKLKNWDSLRAPPLAMVLLPGSLYTFPQTYGPWPLRSRAWCPCTAMRPAPKKTSISWSAAFKPVSVMVLRRGDFVAPDPWADLHMAVTTDWLCYTT